MRILNCTVGEQTSIGLDITVRVITVRGSSVRLGVNAPKHVSVHRLEVYERIKQQGKCPWVVAPCGKN